MDHLQKTEGCSSHWDNQFPSENNSPSQSASGRIVDPNTSIQSCFLDSSEMNLLARFSLSSEDLEELSHLPDSQLTPENMPSLLKALRKRKMALEAPTPPSKSAERERLCSAGDRGPTVKKQVIDYGHKSKYEYNTEPLERNVSNSCVAMDESVEKFPQASRSDPPNRPHWTTDGQNYVRKEYKDHFESPFGVVKASWLPVFSHTELQKTKKLPTPSQMNDYHAMTPRIFPHLCSLCHEDCKDKKDWIQHQKTGLHTENCHRLRLQRPDWHPEVSSSSKRGKGDGEERGTSRRRSASPSPEDSRYLSSDQARHRTRSPSRSSGYYKTSWPRSRSPRRLPSPRPRARSPQDTLNSSRQSWSSSSKERRSGNTSRSPERQRTRTPCSEKRLDERKQTHSSSDCREKRREDLEQTREGGSCQKPSADETGSQEPKREILAPKGQTCDESEHSALASLTEKSVPQVMALFQGGEAAGGRLHRGRGSAWLAAEAVDMSAVPSDLVSMIQLVATQITEAVLDSKEVSSRQASTSEGGQNPKQVHSATRKAEKPSGVSPNLQQRTSTSGFVSHPQTASCVDHLPAILDSKEVSSRQAVTSKGGQNPERVHSATSKSEKPSGVSPNLQQRTSTSGFVSHPQTASCVDHLDSKEVSSRQASTSEGGQNPERVHSATRKAENPRTPGQASKLRVWICGESLIVSAQKRAAATRIGSQLSLEESIILEWHGQENLMWDEFLPFLRNQTQVPDVLIIHLGENDKAYTWRGLLGTLKRHFFQFKKEFPKVKVVWSEMIPWGRWHGGKREKQRKKVNGIAGQSVRSHGGALIKHPNISPELCIDELNLSDAALDIFLEDIKNGILAYMLQPRGATGGELNQGTSLPPPASPAAAAAAAGGLLSVSHEIATQEDEMVSSSQEALSMQPNAEEGAVSPQPASSEAENSGVAGSSSQPGSSKSENQEVEQELVVGSLPTCSGTPGRVAKPRVWICGDSLVTSAQKWALQKRLFSPLDPLEQSVVLEWHGQEDMTWTRLVPTLQNLAAQSQAPDVLIVHLGEKDLLRTPWPELSGIIKKEVLFLREAFPIVRLLWSEMLPQRIWPKTERALEVERVHREVNSVVGRFISSVGGAVIRHVEMPNRFPVLNIRGDNLSHVGLDTFLEDLKTGILSHVLGSNEAAGSGLSKSKGLPPLAHSVACAGGLVL
ncbi:uncharacterized protein LOC129336593 [Eublepharis macularius]|uniref:Uncharacterized protein LOC129336593 n=1 Tax=Eublepharis macularius TaxID=481883 RepID=A0AA97JUS7_EUBMA|nr:uncharacterized protein LOC129336593 [Eublepharis macularius]XP_054845758.1 uncharacterized protein LOC129336593 [Eublepharis macularius]